MAQPLCRSTGGDRKPNEPLLTFVFGSARFSILKALGPCAQILGMESPPLTADKLFAPVTRRYDRHSIPSAERECRHTTGD